MASILSRHHCATGKPLCCKRVFRSAATGDECPSTQSALLPLGLCLSSLPQSEHVKQEKRYLHKSGRGTHLKALLRCKAQLLYTGIGFVAPELLAAILCFLTSCGERMPER